MRALYFTKIDFIKTKPQMIMAPFIMLFVGLIMLLSNADGSSFNVVTLFVYMLFIAIVFSTAPFGECRRKDVGFLMLLPAGTRDRVVGRFLYGILLQVIAASFGAICAVVYRVLGREGNPADLSVCLIGLSVGILLMSAQYVFFYLFGENSGTQLLNFARVIPGMCYFMGAVYVSNMLKEQPERVTGTMEAAVNLLNIISIISVVAALIVLVAAISLCIQMTEKRDC